MSLRKSCGVLSCVVGVGLFFALSRRSSQSWSAARLPEGSRHLLRCGVAPRCPPRGRAAATPPAPGKLPLLPPPGESCCRRRRLPASDGGEVASPLRCEREEPPAGAPPLLRRCLPVPPRAGGMMEPPAAAAACASCRRRPLPPPLLCLLLAALCLPPGERAPARPREGATRDRPVPAARNLAEGRPGPQVAVPARRSLLPAGPPAFPPSFPASFSRSSPTPTAGSLRGRAPVSLPAVGALRIPFRLRPLLPPGKAAEGGRRGGLMPSLS